MITAEQIRELPLNGSRARRMITWTWQPSGNVHALAKQTQAVLERWQAEYPERVLAFDVYGSALGVIQAVAIVEWVTSFKVSMKAREISEIMRRRLGYPGMMPRIESLAKRSGGNLRRIDGARDDPGVPGEPDSVHGAENCPLGHLH